MEGEYILGYVLLVLHRWPCWVSLIHHSSRLIIFGFCAYFVYYFNMAVHPHKGQSI